MRTIAIVMMLSAFAAAPAMGQAPPKLGQLEIKAYQKIPKAKAAVQLTSDTALGRHLRGLVMEQLAKRGNEVGFSGGNVMRMDVTFLDLLGQGSNRSETIGGQPPYADTGSNPRPEMPANRVQRRDLIEIPKSSSSLRIGLTLYSVSTGKVIWAATASCPADGGNVQRVGEAMVDSIFRDADRSQVADAGCPL
ncbi:MAG: hypothetical protein JSR90_13785 [Proteobacteria bacterium]|nr:hypothetical protein [Pseudomonadota bacterium]